MLSHVDVEAPSVVPRTSRELSRDVSSDSLYARPSLMQALDYTGAVMGT